MVPQRYQAAGSIFSAPDELMVMPGSAHGTYLGAAEAARPGSPLVDLAVTTIESFLSDRL